MNLEASDVGEAFAAFIANKRILILFMLGFDMHLEISLARQSLRADVTLEGSSDFLQQAFGFPSSCHAIEFSCANGAQQLAILAKVIDDLWTIIEKLDGIVKNCANKPPL